MPLFSVENRHVKDCGVPGEFDGNKEYTSYFEGECRDQFIFTFDRSTQECTLRSGGYGWNKVYTGKVIGDFLKEVMLGKAGMLWLSACFEAVSIRKPLN